MTVTKTSTPRSRPSASGCRHGLSWRSLAIIFAVAVVMRAGLGTFRLWSADDINTLEFPDERQYWLMASSLADGDGLEDEFGFRATRMPLYAGLLSVFTGTPSGVVVAKGFQWLIGAVGAVLTAGLAMSVFERRTGLIAGLIVACDPFLVFFSSLLLTETLFVTGLVGLWWVIWSVLAARGRQSPIPGWLAAGVIGAFCVYTRESSLGLVLVLFALCLISRRFEPRSILGAIVAASVIVATLVPWAVRNQRVTGDWCWLTHRAGVSLYDGVGLQATGASDLADIQQMPEVIGMTEVEWNAHFLQESISQIKADPARIARLAGVKLGLTWNPVPNVDTYRSRLVQLVSASWTVPIFAFAVGGVILLVKTKKREGWWIALFLLLPALYISAVHCLFVGSVRYRIPAIPMIEILAAFTVAMILERLRSNRKPDSSATGNEQGADS